MKIDASACCGAPLPLPTQLEIISTNQIKIRARHMIKNTNIISRTRPRKRKDTKLQNADVETLIASDSEKLNGFVQLYYVDFFCDLKHPRHIDISPLNRPLYSTFHLFHLNDRPLDHCAHQRFLET